MRSWDAKIVAEAVTYLTNDFDKEFDAISWIADQSNFLFTNDLGDYAIFEHGKNPLRLVGHYYFKSRGKAAVKAARQFLKEAFDMGVVTIAGTTPLQYLGARWMSRHLGFTSHGVVDTITGPHEIFILHRDQYEAITRNTE